MVVSFPLFVSWVETSGGARLIGGRGRGRNARPVWQISSGFPSLSAHLLVHPGDDCHGIRRELEQLLDERFVKGFKMSVRSAPRLLRTHPRITEPRREPNSNFETLKARAPRVVCPDGSRELVGEGSAIGNPPASTLGRKHEP